MIQVAEIVDAQGEPRVVDRITIEVGPLSGTEPALLLNAFLAMRSGVASTAELRIERCPVGITCLECGAHSETRPNRLICAHCGGWRTRVITGDGLRLLRVEMRLADPPDGHPSLNPMGKVHHV
jgi:hydrogenase nickel incorporation protein HypA/HybF